MSNLTELLGRAVAEQASDIFIVAGFPLACKKNGSIVAESAERLHPDESKALLRDIYSLAARDIERLLHSGDDDFSFAIPGLSRFRVSAYKQRGSLAAVIRVVSFGIPDHRELHIPDEVMAVARYTKGLVLVTGPAGSGKSTTLACIVDAINSERNGHIITLEEPIEYLHRNKKSIVSQREIELDTESYVKSLRACLRQAPNVILVGEMRDYETIKTAMTAAETGHLIISSLHTVGAANTIDRVIDVFPPSQQQQIRVQLSMLLQAVISQQLVPTEGGDIIPVFEIMNVNAAVRNMIRESKIHQLDAVIAQGAADGMRSMDAALLDLYKRGVISRENALRYAANMDLLAKRL
ncbi:MAG: PilT/PilU family type 4a pilus ATPase [Bacillota bacterium]|nr:PilT/PilU family type 4a pilus ATPase [Bacillota bacterium]